ncbi:MAG: type II secretion system protein GspD [Planctomycetes bacterium]|nr:type II secretion system protein GspD [Planctomycetota bacterium]
MRTSPPRLAILLASALLLESCATPRQSAPADEPLDAPAPREADVSAVEAASAPSLPRRQTPVALQEPSLAELVPELNADTHNYTIELRGVSLAQALGTIGELGKLNLMLVGDFADVVDISFPGVRLSGALEVLLERYGAHLERTAGICTVTRRAPNESRTEVFTLSSIPASELEAQLQTIAGTGAQVVVNATRNIVMVTANESALQDVRDWLAAVDKNQRQVLIEARILEVSRQDLLKLGTELALHNIELGSGTANFVTGLLTGATNGVLDYANPTDNIDASIDALSRHARVNVLSKPKLLTLNQKPAKFEVVSQVPYVNSSTTTQGSNTGTGTVTVTDVQFKDVGLKLTVTPEIQENGYISLSVTQTTSEQTGTFQGVPVIDNRLVQTDFLVGDGETALIAGILKTRDARATNGVPWIEQIPIVGLAFQGRDDEQSSIDLVITITPRIVHQDER